jgi:hypothetical protein
MQALFTLFTLFLLQLLITDIALKYGVCSEAKNRLDPFKDKAPPRWG